MPEGHDTTIEVSNIMSFVLYTQILKQSVLKPASPGITLSTYRPIHIYSTGHNRGYISDSLWDKCTALKQHNL